MTNPSKVYENTEINLEEMPVGPSYFDAVNRVIDEYPSITGYQLNGRAGYWLEKDQRMPYAVARLIDKPEPNRGFNELRDKRRLDATFEAVIVHFKKLFDPRIVELAEFRLREPYAHEKG